MYKSPVFSKIIYTKACTLTDEERENIKKEYKIVVKLIPEDGTIREVLQDLKKEHSFELISIEAGSTTTADLYDDETKPNPIDVHFLTRYRGPINEEAVGLKFTSIG